ncbi:MAG: hypothetical protein HUJ70_11780 [Pseudobutyrivibrio sp.]|nr:hypothetical protein [Pseudobutyrivibrio sp.]
MKFVKAIPALLAATCIFAGQIGSANAYFTTYVNAAGGFTVSWDHKEKIKEEFTNWHKYVTISADPASTMPVFVRAKAFTGSTYKLDYAGTDWKLGKDDFYYYQKVLNPGETTNTLNVGIENIPLTPKAGDNFNVIVIYESIPAYVDANGNHEDPEKADWNVPLGTVEENHNVNPGGGN